jgi:hypothetical protein
LQNTGISGFKILLLKRSHFSNERDKFLTSHDFLSNKLPKIRMA